MTAKKIHDDLLPYIKGIIWEYRFLIRKNIIHELRFCLNGETINHYNEWGLKLILSLIEKEKEK